MAQIAPFAALHFDPIRVSLDQVIAPPYDVISPEQQEALYRQHPENIVRLILNQKIPTDNDLDNRYTRAAAYLQDVLTRGILQQDTSPALYEYVQIFPHPLDPQRQMERRTLFVALKLESYDKGVVLPHEETHPKAKADRLLLMRATHANTEPIYGLYVDPDQIVAQRLLQARASHAPLLQATLPGAAGPEQHLVYRHTQPALLRDIAAFFAPLRVWIADGHHRYETALNYQHETSQAKQQLEKQSEQPNEGQEAARQQEASAENLPADYILIGLSAFEDPGMVVLPTHRLVKNVPAARLEDLPLQLQRFFHVSTLPLDQARAWIKTQIAGEQRFLIVLPDKAYALTLRDQAQAQAAMEQAGAAHSPAWRHLDVTLLQTLVLDRSLGISWQALAHTPDVAYTREEAEAVQKVQSGEYQIACLLQNPTVTEVRDVAAAGDKMPQKSTFFYPKLYSGLVLRSLEPAPRGE